MSIVILQFLRYLRGFLFLFCLLYGICDHLLEYLKNVWSLYLMDSKNKEKVRIEFGLRLPKVKVIVTIQDTVVPAGDVAVVLAEDVMLAGFVPLLGKANINSYVSQDTDLVSTLSYWLKELVGICMEYGAKS